MVLTEEQKKKKNKLLREAKIPKQAKGTTASKSQLGTPIDPSLTSKLGQGLTGTSLDPNPVEATPQANPQAQPTVPEASEGSHTGRQNVTLPDGRSFIGLSRSEAEGLVSGYTSSGQIAGSVPQGTAQTQLDQQIAGQQQAGEVGQFGQLGVSPTGIDAGEALTTGLVSSIPNVLRMAGQAAVGGAVIGAGAGLATGGVFSVPLAIVGAGVTFAASLASSMTNNMKAQRRDTTTAQQRVLDEGKQNLNDWATLAAANPASRQEYIKNFNQQLALIDQAHRQMKLDTSRDIAKFETALPNLAEFETFYSTQGERDFLITKMQQALLTPSTNEYEMLELSDRRK